MSSFAFETETLNEKSIKVQSILPVISNSSYLTFVWKWFDMSTTPKKNVIRLTNKFGIQQGGIGRIRILVRKHNPRKLIILFHHLDFVSACSGNNFIKPLPLSVSENGKRTMLIPCFALHHKAKTKTTQPNLFIGLCVPNKTFFSKSTMCRKV